MRPSLRLTIPVPPAQLCPGLQGHTYTHAQRVYPAGELRNPSSLRPTLRQSIKPTSLYPVHIPDVPATSFKIIPYLHNKPNPKPP